MALRRALRLLSSLATGRMIYAHFAVTHRCNLACRMCAARRDVQGELSLPEVAAAARTLRRLGVVYLSVSGGEPLLRDDLGGILRALRGMDFRFRVLTNGTLADAPRMRELARAGLREVSVSLHSLDPAKHDAVGGTPGAHAAVLRNLEAIGASLRGSGNVLLLNTVVSPLNIAELPRMADFAREAGYLVSFVPIEDRPGGEFAFREADHPLVYDVYARLAAMKRGGRSAIFNSSLFLEQSRRHLTSRRRVWSCEAGRRYCSVNPAGMLSICHRFPPEGSLLDGALPGRLGAPAYERRRRELIGSCAGCLRPCWAEVTNVFADRGSLAEMARNLLGRTGTAESP